MQDVVLALLAKEPSHGYQLRGRLRSALGPLAGGLNEGQVYVMLARLDKAGLVVSTSGADADRKVYELTAAGHQRVLEWLAEVDWPKPDFVQFHLKLVAAASARIADPVALVDAQRRELLHRLRDAQRARLDELDGSASALLVEGLLLRLRADLRWLEACERTWVSQLGGES